MYLRMRGLPGVWRDSLDMTHEHGGEHGSELSPQELSANELYPKVLGSMIRLSLLAGGYGERVLW